MSTREHFPSELREELAIKICAKRWDNRMWGDMNAGGRLDLLRTADAFLDLHRTGQLDSILKANLP